MLCVENNPDRYTNANWPYIILIDAQNYNKIIADLKKTLDGTSHYSYLFGKNIFGTTNIEMKIYIFGTQHLQTNQK